MMCQWPWLIVIDVLQPCLCVCKKHHTNCCEGVRMLELGCLFAIHVGDEVNGVA